MDARDLLAIDCQKPERIVLAQVALVDEGQLDQLSGTALLEAIRTALRSHGFGDPGEWAAREAAVRAAETSVARAGDDEVRAAVERIVREVAREVVPPIAERLIREEIQRLRREHGFEDPPR